MIIPRLIICPRLHSLLCVVGRCRISSPNSQSPIALGATDFLGIVRPALPHLPLKVARLDVLRGELLLAIVSRHTGLHQACNCDLLRVPDQASTQSTISSTPFSYQYTWYCLPCTRVCVLLAVYRCTRYQVYWYVGTRQAVPVAGQSAIYITNSDSQRFQVFARGFHKLEYQL